MIFVQAVVEDTLQEAILHKLLQIYRPDISIIGVSGKKGNSYIKSGIRAFNEASKHLPHIVLADLDRKPCAPALLAEWINFPTNPKLLFRIVQREVEAWILADRAEIARYIGIPENRIPYNTQELEDPKEHIINLARKSRKRIIRDIVPQGISSQGPGYNPLLQEFVFKKWCPERAAQNNTSLQKAINRLMSYLK